MKSKINDARIILESQRNELTKKKREIDEEIYKLDQAIKALNSVNDLQRVRRVKRTSKCMICNEEFQAGNTLAKICKKKECISEKRKRAYNGEILIQGVQK